VLQWFYNATFFNQPYETVSLYASLHGSHCILFDISAKLNNIFYFILFDISAKLNNIFFHSLAMSVQHVMKFSSTLNVSDMIKLLGD
jgi:hypothetical protein